MKKLIDFFLNKEFFTFLVIGVINTFTGVFFAMLYSSFLNENIAFAVGYATGIVVSYILNSCFTFKQALEFSKFLKFAISNVPNFIIQNVTVFIVFNMLAFPKLIAYGLAAIIGIPVTFLFLKVFAFRKKEEEGTTYK